jgi:integrase
MASISSDKNGNRVIQFVAGDGKRRSIRLGKLPLKAVREIKTKIESLNGAAVAGIGWDKETAEWVGGRESALYNKLAAVGLTPKRADSERAALAGFVESYLNKRSDIKPRTRLNLQQVQRNLVLFFGADKPLAEITEGDADDWRIWLAQNEVRHNGKTIKGKLGPNTVRRQCGRARQLFRAALKRRLIASNPFGEMKGITVQANTERFYFVSRDDAAKVLAACPDAQWRLLFALSRFGGLRCPSEHLELRWSDIDWKRGRMTVRSPKTERHEGKESRVVPIFNELRPYLEQVRAEVKRETEYVISRYRDSNSNLRTQLMRFIRKAGLQPWPKLFQNLRSTRETELAEMYPIHVVCKWIGNSQSVAKEHYLQVTDSHFEAALRALHNPVQLGAEVARSDSQSEMPHPVPSEGCYGMRQCTSVQIPPARLELAT